MPKGVSRNVWKGRRQRDNGIKSQQLKCNTERPLLLAIKVHWSKCVHSNSGNKTLRKLSVVSFYLAWTHVYLRPSPMATSFALGLGLSRYMCAHTYTCLYLQMYTNAQPRACVPETQFVRQSIHNSLGNGTGRELMQITVERPQLF